MPAADQAVGAVADRGDGVDDELQPHAVRTLERFLDHRHRLAGVVEHGGVAGVGAVRHLHLNEVTAFDAGGVRHHESLALAGGTDGVEQHLARLDGDRVGELVSLPPTTEQVEVDLV